MSDELVKLRNIMSREIVGELRTHAIIQQETDTIFDRAATEIVRLQQQIVLLRAERDEARRSCCEYAAIVDGADTADGMESGRFYEIAMKYMKDRGWDCFKENTND